MITKGSTVTAHTGSTKNRTYRHVTATVVDFETRMIGRNHYYVVYVMEDAEGNVYREAKSRLTEVEAPEVAPEPETAPEPRSIRFTTVVCSRCDGERRNPAWGKVAGGWCFQCGGVGTLMTRDALAAEEMMERLRDERLGAKYSELAMGEAYKRNGKWFEKAGAWHVYPDTLVHRHNGAITRQIWAEVAAAYPKGVTLVY